MFKIDQAVNSPKGKAYILEVSDNIAYVEMTNGVEMDFLIADIQDWDEFKAEEDATFKAERERHITSLHQAHQANQPTLMQRLALGQAMLDGIFAGDPKGRKEFTNLAGELLMAKVERVIAEHEGKV